MLLSDVPHTSGRRAQHVGGRTTASAGFDCGWKMRLEQAPLIQVCNQADHTVLTLSNATLNIEKS